MKAQSIEVVQTIKFYNVFTLRRVIAVELLAGRVSWL